MSETVGLTAQEIESAKVDIEAVRNRSAVINAQVSKINNQRNVNIGTKTTLEKQLQDWISKYKTQFGVDLSVANLAEEIKTVVAEKEREEALLTSILTALSSGKYELANQLADGTYNPSNLSGENTTASAQSQSAVTAPVTETSTVSEPVSSPVSVTAPTESQVSAPVVAPPTPTLPLPDVSAFVTPPVPMSAVPNGAPLAPNLGQVSGASDYMANVAEEKSKLAFPALEGFTNPTANSTFGAPTPEVAPPSSVTEVSSQPQSQSQSQNQNDVVAPPSPKPATFASITGGTPFGNA